METNDIVMSGLQLKRLIEKKVEPIIAKYHLRPVELDILVFLDREKDSDTAKEIMKKKHWSKAHISKSIDNLRTQGFIQIEEDVEDHRVLHIHLTDKSQQVIGKVLETYEECRQIMQKGISNEELEVVKHVMCKINDNINRELGEQCYEIFLF